MPIFNDENDNVKINYSIPDDVLLKIPEYFYCSLYGELCALYGASVFDADDGEWREIYDHESTCGWYAAIWSACNNTEQFWLYKYYNDLPWYDSDLFDDEICRLVIEKCHQPSVTQLFYYDYLNRKMGEEGVCDC